MLDIPPFKYKKHHPDARIDYPAKEGDVGYDIYSIKEIFIPNGESREVPVGLSFEPPRGYYFTVETRGSHGVKNNLRVHRGIVDNGYRGILSVKVYNHNKAYDFETLREGYTVKKGEKIAQLVLHKMELFSLLEVQELSPSERGEQGFGSTGK